MNRQKIISAIVVLLLGAILPLLLLATLVALHLPDRLGHEVRAEAALTRIEGVVRGFLPVEFAKAATHPAART